MTPALKTCHTVGMLNSRTPQVDPPGPNDFLPEWMIYGTPSESIWVQHTAKKSRKCAQRQNKRLHNLEMFGMLESIGVITLAESTQDLILNDVDRWVPPRLVFEVCLWMSCIGVGDWLADHCKHKVPTTMHRATPMYFDSCTTWKVKPGRME